MRQAKERCERCGQDIGTAAAHTCPHGKKCRFKSDRSDIPIDWKTLECDQCVPTSDLVEYHPRTWHPTEVGWNYPLPAEAVAKAKDSLARL